ncbi:MAG: S-layer homology domain-containing protein [Solobacterium sp.]|nr:S-layer homology domain-containing protein [Solobacterium sp.]
MKHIYRVLLNPVLCVFLMLSSGISVLGEDEIPATDEEIVLNDQNDEEMADDHEEEGNAELAEEAGSSDGEEESLEVTETDPDEIIDSTETTEESSVENEEEVSNEEAEVSEEIIPEEESIQEETPETENTEEEMAPEQEQAAEEEIDTDPEDLNEIEIPEADEGLSDIVDVSSMVIQSGAIINTSDFEYEELSQYNSSSSAQEYLATTAFDIDRDFASLNKTFVAAAEKRSSSINVSSYNIPVGKISLVFSKLMNSNPQLFYVGSQFRYYYSGSYVTSINPQYNSSYGTAAVTAFNNRVNSIISETESSWSAEQKALFLHDKIVTETEYDTTLSRFNAYQALVEGNAVCQGYALAYKYLLNKAGITSDVISSDVLNHAWNTAVIGGKTYYVDCTWDDPVGVYRMFCNHENMLRNRDEMVQSGHNSTDWADSSGKSIYSSLALYKYPSSYWDSTLTMIPHVSDLWAYTTDTGIYVHDYSTGSNRLVTSRLNDYWETVDGYSYYQTKFIHLDSYLDKFVVSQQDAVYLVDVYGNISTVGSLTASEMNSGRIYGIRREGTKVRYDLYSDLHSDNFVKSGYFTLGSDSAIRIAFTTSRINLMINGSADLKQYLSTNATYIKWSSSNSSIVKVSDGIVTAVNGGTATITATAGKQKATIQVSVTVPINHIEMKEQTVKAPMQKGKTIEVVYYPSNTTEKTLTWKSADTSVATVDSSGVVTGKKLGSTVITATAVNGSSASCIINVLFSDVMDESAFYFNYVYDLAEKNIVTGWADGTFRPSNNCNRAAVVTFLWRMLGRPEPSEMAGFSDMTGNEEFDMAISWAAENGITTGWDDNTFRPWNTCNRAAVMTFLWRAAGKPEPATTAEFQDMTGNADFDTAISWGVENGITTGWADNTFRPWNTCNRLAVVSFLGRYDALRK